MTESTGAKSEHNSMVIQLSLKKTDVDLLELFAPLLKGEKSLFARSLMRDGLKWRMQNGISLTNGSTEIVNIESHGNVVPQAQTSSQAKNEPSQPPVIPDLDITPHKGKENSSEEIIDYTDPEALSALFAKEHLP